MVGIGLPTTWHFLDLLGGIGRYTQARDEHVQQQQLGKFAFAFLAW